MLSRWAIPDELVAAAPESPYFFDPDVFIRAADEAIARTADTPSDAAARAALPRGGTVLDVGVGAGAAGLALADRAGRVVGVDTSPEMLDAFATRAARLGVQWTVIEGRWPDAASAAPRSEVVVCHHVFYNVADLASFATALTDRAAARVVVELTTVHPLAWMRPYWEALHGRAQPDRPTVDDAVDLVVRLGVDVHQQRWRRQLQMIGENDVDAVARLARRLCLPAARHDELRSVLAERPPPQEREVATLWWDTT
jgi:SAM-dependent methyltransferase